MSHRRAHVGALLVTLGAGCGAGSTARTAPPRTSESVTPPAPASVASSTGSAPRPDVARRLAEASTFLQRHCSGCHDGSLPLDFRAAPSPERREIWEKISTQVESGRMPPPSRSTPFPLTPGERARLSDLASRIAEAATPAPPPGTRQLSADVWLTLLASVARDLEVEEKVRAVPSAYLGGFGGLHGANDTRVDPNGLGFILPPLGWLGIDNIARESCAILVRADETKAPVERDAFVTRWFRRVYRQDPTPGDVADGGALLDRVAAKYGAGEARTALCTFYFTSPKLWFLPSGG